jgi:hypothetical protein
MADPLTTLSAAAFNGQSRRHSAMMHCQARATAVPGSKTLLLQKSFFPPTALGPLNTRVGEVGRLVQHSEGMRLFGKKVLFQYLFSPLPSFSGSG